MKAKQKLSKPPKGVRPFNLTLLDLIFHICLERGALPPFKFPSYSSSWGTFILLRGSPGPIPQSKEVRSYISVRVS
jgi:hypothetical protein